MLGCINSPASGIANSMNAVLTKLVRTLDAAKDKLPAQVKKVKVISKKIKEK